MVQVVIPALIPEIPKLYDIYFEAFKNDEMGQVLTNLLFPAGIDDPEFRKAHAAATLDYWTKSDTQFTVKCIETETGEILGMGFGDLVLSREVPKENDWHGVTWLEGEERERAEAILKPLWLKRHELLGGQQYIYVHVIAVHPKHQGKKAGMALCQWGLEHSEKLQIPLYFESSPSTIGLYRKAGFEELEEKIVHKAEVLGLDHDITVPLMIKMPSGAKGMSFEQWRQKGFPRIVGKSLNSLVGLNGPSAGLEPGLLAAVIDPALLTSIANLNPVLLSFVGLDPELFAEAAAIANEKAAEEKRRAEEKAAAEKAAAEKPAEETAAPAVEEAPVEKVAPVIEEKPIATTV